ncbi:hypothetical protein [Pedobacter frigoris]|uniref:hypothetical protein n=1 Tax=Pedobacter frigoris TaxID=2571272 RepID=UPI00292FCC20|nr:hypothetical protein [Pedobacter frigoris]
MKNKSKRGIEPFIYKVIQFLQVEKEFKTKDGIVLSATENNMVRASKILKLAGNRTCELYKVYNAEDYKGNVALSRSELEQYEVDDLFTRHYPIYINILDLDMELTFQLRLYESDDDENFEMVIHSLQDHFYDECKELESEKDYVDYLNSREGLLYAVHECRNKFSNAK